MHAMPEAPEVTLLPLLGALHLRFPRYNAVVVDELLTRERPDALALEPLPAAFADDPSWRDTEELLLPWVVVPWAARRSVPAIGVFEGSPDPHAPDDLARYLAAYPRGRDALDAIALAERPLAELLARPLTLEGILDEVVPALATLRRARLEAFGDGPGTDWVEARADVVAERVLDLPAARTLVPVAIDRYLPLRDALERRGASVRVPATPPPSEAARERALLDLAWRGEGADVHSLLERLRELARQGSLARQGTPAQAEARYHAANLLLAHDHAAEALEELEAVMRLEFAHPPFLPGLVLARLGQLRDLAGRRDDALRAYRGVLALEWAPEPARAAAQAGLERPFEVPRDEADGSALAPPGDRGDDG
jgi:hypothetical protein